MKLSVEHLHLSKGLSVVSRAVSGRSVLSVLDNVLLEANGAGLKLAATDLTMAIVCHVPADTEAEGKITLPARLLSEYVGGLPPDRIALELNERTQAVKLASGCYDATIKGITADEFPVLPDTGGDGTIRIMPDVLRRAIGQVAFSALTDESRPNLSGVCIDFFPDSRPTILAATDGFRLSVRTLNVDHSQPPGASLLIPATTLQELARIAADADPEQPVEVAVNVNQVCFQMQGREGKGWERVTVISQLIDARYPDYSAIVPKTSTTRVVASVAEFAKAVKLAQLFARDASQIVKLEVAEAAVTVSAISQETGDTTSVIEAEVVGPGLTIAFNGAYLLQALGAIGQDRVSLELTKGSAPGLLRPVPDDGFQHVIMPMQLTR